MVIASRGRGKTYGLRQQFMKDWIAHRWRFVEIARTKAELPRLMSSYFDRLAEAWPDYVFKTDRGCGWVARAGTKKPDWQIIGYFVAMSQYQQLKKQTFAHVRRILLDEAVMESADRYHRYLPDEWNVLASIVDTVSREQEGDTPPRVYLLGNATDILNPYFEHAGITGQPKKGYSWHCHKTFLLDYDDAPAYAERKSRTVAGMMESGDAMRQALENIFTEQEKFQKGRKPADASPVIGLSLHGRQIGVWLSMRKGYYYVCRQMPPDNMTYTLALTDRPNYLILPRAQGVVRSLYQSYGQRLVLFDTAKSYGTFVEILQYMGIRR